MMRRKLPATQYRQMLMGQLFLRYFYDALEKPEAVRKFYTDETLIELTKELTDQLRRNWTVDRDRRDDARAHMMRLVKSLLRKYTPDAAEGALQTVIRQCELWVDTIEFVVGSE